MLLITRIDYKLSWTQLGPITIILSVLVYQIYLRFFGRIFFQNLIGLIDNNS